MWSPQLQKLFIVILCVSCLSENHKRGEKDRREMEKILTTLTVLTIPKKMVRHVYKTHFEHIRISISTKLFPVERKNIVHLSFAPACYHSELAGRRYRIIGTITIKKLFWYLWDAVLRQPLQCELLQSRMKRCPRRERSARLPKMHQQGTKKWIHLTVPREQHDPHSHSLSVLTGTVLLHSHF